MPRDRVTREEEKKLYRVICLKCRDESWMASAPTAFAWMDEHSCSAQQEAGPRSKRHFESVEGEGSGGGGE